MSLKEYFNSKQQPTYFSGDFQLEKPLSLLEEIQEKLYDFYDAPISSTNSMNFKREVWIKRAEELVILGKRLQQEIESNKIQDVKMANVVLARIKQIEQQLEEYLKNNEGM